MILSSSSRFTFNRLVFGLVAFGVLTAHLTIPMAAVRAWRPTGPQRWEWRPVLPQAPHGQLVTAPRQGGAGSSLWWVPVADNGNGPLKINPTGSHPYPKRLESAAELVDEALDYGGEDDEAKKKPGFAPPRFGKRSEWEWSLFPWNGYHQSNIDHQSLGRPRKKRFKWPPLHHYSFIHSSTEFSKWHLRCVPKKGP